MTTPNFYAIIPAHVRYCKDLEPNAKLLYGEITALSQQEGYCWANNRYFAELYDVKERSIQNWIGSLKRLGFIDVELLTENGQSTRRLWISKEIRKIYTGRKKMHPPMKDSSPPHEKNYTHNTTPNITSEETPPPSPQETKEARDRKWWRREFSSWNEEEFDYVWKEYISQKPGHVRSPKIWMQKVHERYVGQKGHAMEINEKIEKRRLCAKQYDETMTKWRGDTVTAYPDRVEFTQGSYFKAVRYDVSDQEWAQQTGWAA